jgi:hypothetical protein
MANQSLTNLLGLDTYVLVINSPSPSPQMNDLLCALDHDCLFVCVHPQVDKLASIKIQHVIASKHAQHGKRSHTGSTVTSVAQREKRM